MALHPGSAHHRSAPRHRPLTCVTCTASASWRGVSATTPGPPNSGGSPSASWISECSPVPSFSAGSPLISRTIISSICHVPGRFCWAMCRSGIFRRRVLSPVLPVERGPARVRLQPVRRSPPDHLAGRVRHDARVSSLGAAFRVALGRRRRRPADDRGLPAVVQPSQGLPVRRGNRLGLAVRAPWQPAACESERYNQSWPP